jgi:hypothetical protein
MTTTNDPTADVLEGAAFESLYQTQIEPELAGLEAKRGGAMRFFLIGVAIAVALAVVEFLIPLPLFFPIATGVIGALIAYVPLGRLAQAGKTAVLNALCAPIGVTYVEKNFEAPAYQSFLKLHLLPSSTTSRFEDHFSGARGRVAFAFCEAHLTRHSGKSEVTVFQGQTFQLITPRKLLGTTVVLRDSGWLDRFECPAGLQKVGLEDPNFNHIFAVFGSDQVEAREILTPTFMQQLVDLEKAYGGQHLRCAFVESDLLIAVEGGNRFEIGSMFSTLDDRSRVQSIAQDLESIFHMIDHFQNA